MKAKASTRTSSLRELEMRIYIYTLRFNPKTGGGSHHSLEIFIRALIARGHTPVLTTFHSRDNNYSQKPCEMREENFSGGFLALQKCIASLMTKNMDADVHYLYGPTVMWAGGIYKNRGGTTPVVVSLNNYTPGMGLNRPAPVPNTFVRGILVRARNRIHVIKWYLWERLFGIRLARRIERRYFSSPIIQSLYQRFGYSTQSSLVVAEPMEKTTSDELSAPFPREPGIFHVVFAGRLIADKGPDIIVRAALQLPTNIHIHLIGNGNEETYLQDFVRSNNLTGRVFFHGWKTPAVLMSFYKNADVFVQPSRWPEPFGRTTADAMACGTSIISTENTGSAWAAGDGGIIFKKNNVDDLVRCILFFFNNPAERAAYAKRAIARSRLFDADIVSRQFVADMESLTKK